MGAREREEGGEDCTAIDETQARTAYMHMHMHMHTCNAMQCNAMHQHLLAVPTSKHLAVSRQDERVLLAQRAACTCRWGGG